MKTILALLLIPALAFAQQPAVSPITLTVDPPDAEVWVDEQKLDAGTRALNTPTLESGRTYAYTFAARWGDVTVQQKLSFRGGEPVAVLLSRPQTAVKSIAGRDAALKAGDVFVPLDRRVKNQAGNCVWCAVEECFWGAANLVEFQGIKERALKSGWRGADSGNVIGYIRDWQADGRAGETKVKQGRSYEFFRAACDSGTGAVIFVPGHALFLCGIDETSARVLDNNGPAVVQEWSRQKFDSRVTWGCCPDLPSFLRPNPNRPNPTPNPRHPPLNPDKPVLPKPVEVPGPVGPPVPVTPAPVTQPAVDLDKLAELIIAKLPKAKDGKDGKDGAEGKPAVIDYDRLAEVLAARIKPLPGPAGPPGPVGPSGTGTPGAPATVDYDKLAEEVITRLPPSVAYFDIKKRPQK